MLSLRKRASAEALATYADAVDDAEQSFRSMRPIYERHKESTVARAAAKGKQPEGMGVLAQHCCQRACVEINCGQVKDRSA